MKTSRSNLKVNNCERKYAPICLFTFNRLEETKRTIEALKNNFLATESDLFIFSDGYKNENEKKGVDSVRENLYKISGFKSITISESSDNKGLASSVISGVSSIIHEFGKIIVVEDDLITSSNFLNFMNQALDFFEHDQQIFSISGYTMDLSGLRKHSKDYYMGYRASSWGWATWKDRWENIDWEVKDYKKFIYNPFKHYKFMRGGSDLPYLLWKQMNGVVDSWAIRWCYSQYKNNLLTVFPQTSKIQNIGFSENATHTKKISFSNHVLDVGDKREFQFHGNYKVKRDLVNEFKNNFSIGTRLKNKFTK